MHDAFGKIVGHCAKGRFVVSTRGRFSCRSETTWKSRSAARVSYERYPTSSHTSSSTRVYFRSRC